MRKVKSNFPSLFWNIDMIPNILSLFSLVSAAILFSCATPQLTIQSTPKARVEDLRPDSNDGGSFVGETPLTVDRSKIEKGLIKLSAPGRESVYITSACNPADETKIRVKLPDALQCAGGRESAVPLNKAMRLLLKAYQALSQKDLITAKDLAKQAADMAPGLAAPHIVAGLAALQAGNKEEARTEFGRAQSIDPDDRELDELAKSAK